MFRQLLLSILDLLGLRTRVRQVRKFLKAHGYDVWQPLVPIPEFERALHGAIDRLLPCEPGRAFGDYLEFGVGRGSSMACVGKVLQQRGLKGVRMIGFDSFAGMPPPLSGDNWQAGDYHSSLAATRRHLRRQGLDLDRIRLVKGWFRDTLNDETRVRLGLRKTRLIVIDCDNHAGTVMALQFCASLIPDRAVVIFDDWGWEADRGVIGQREAFKDFLGLQPDIRIEPLPGYTPQSRIFLLQREIYIPSGPGIAPG